VKILVVEDDPKIAGFLVKGLRQSGYNAEPVHDGSEALQMALGGAYDAAVVDLMVPGLDGLSLITRLRAAGHRMPVLILSARRTVDDRVRGLQAGGDDYMVKPFSFSELEARLQALLRRSGESADPARLVRADLSLDRIRREVRRGGRLISLQPREFSLLELFLRHPGRILTKTEILEKIYDYSFDPQTNVVDVLVCRLRNKVDRDFEPKLIHTVRGVGYVLKEGGES
jgi:DNA-binding response OmpR family regulator